MWASLNKISLLVFVISVLWTKYRGAPWAPTPMSMVHKMLTMAHVGSGDVVYDLGCGDGRMLVTAVRRYGARAVQYNGVSHEVGVRCGNFERILETADLPRFGEESKTELTARLDDPDSAVRFWAVTGLCALGVDSALVDRLNLLVDDPSISVSLAVGDYLVRVGEGALALPAFARALESDILWTRIRAGAYLSYRNREELQPMKPLLSVLQAAIENQSMFGPDVIGRRWILERVMKRIELSHDYRSLGAKK